MRSSKFRWSRRVLGIGLGLVACSACGSDSRRTPTPLQMCEALATECRGLGHDHLDDCQQIGARGLREAAQQDQCYAFYDGCIDECRFVARWGLHGDAGADGDGDQSPADAGETDAAGAGDSGASDASDRP